MRMANCSLEQQKTPQPVVAKLIATPDAVSRLSPALADAILPFLNKFPDACFGLPFAFALMHDFAKATASKRAKSRVVWQRPCEHTSKGSSGTLLAAFFPLGRADGGFARLLADVLPKRGSAGLCSFARSGMTGKVKVRRGDGVGEAEAEHDDEAMDYLLKPSLPFVAGLSLGIAIAKATAVAKIRIKQFWAIRLAGKVVAVVFMMAMPLFLFDRDVGPRSRMGGAAGRIDSGGDRYRHEDISRMAGRTHGEE